MAHTSMSLFEECKNVAADLQRKKVNFNKSLSKLLVKTYSVSLGEASKFAPREEVGSSKCEKAVVELRRVMSCGELLVRQWSDKQLWKTVISSSDSASLQAKVVLHLKEFFVCVQVLRVIANGNQNLLFDHRNALLSEVRDLELSMSTVESDVEKACKEDLDSLKSWIQDKIKGWFVRLDDVKLANLVLEQLKSPGNSSVGHQSSSKSEYTDVIIGNRLLGEGGGGKVLACEFLGLEAAAKVFLASSSNNAKVVETEAQLFARLRHPNVVRFIAHVVDKDQHVIVSEWMQMDLRKYLDEFNKGGDGSPRGLPLFETVDIMLQIAQGMRYLHDGQMMHRDLKSKNVLVNVIPGPDSRVFSSVLQVKVTDFGLAKLKTDNSRFTTRGVGTTKWRAPEVFEDDNNPGKYKKSADVYSFAMVFFEVLTGEIPFDDIPLGKLLQRLHRGLRPHLPRNECPKYLSALIKKCWSRNAARRPTFATICKTLVNCKVAILAAQSPSPRHILSYDSDDESRRSPSRLCRDCHFLL
jgi:serine/threonine protein kinase